MGATDLIQRLSPAGVRLSLLAPDRSAAEPGEALTDDLRTLIRENKVDLIVALAPLQQAREVRRARVLAMLDDDPQRQRAAIFEATADSQHVVCSLAIRHVGTCEILIPQTSFDPWATLRALDATQ